MAKESTPAERAFLLELPTELLVDIFGSTTSFGTATQLAASCKQLNLVWKEHLTTIYGQLAPVALPCYDALRRLIADQGHLPIDANSLKEEDIIRFVQTSKNGQELVEEYERAMSIYPYCDPQVPLVLSPTEKDRFIEANYQVWGLLRLSEKDRTARIKEMDLTQLCILSDFLCNFNPKFINDSAIQELIGENVSICRRLQMNLRRQRNLEFQRIHEIAYRPRDWTPYERGGRFAWWCDQQQETFARMIDGSLFQSAAGDDDEEEEEESE